MKTTSLYSSLLLALFIMAFTFTKTLVIKGRVLNESRSPIAGASVIVKGTNTGTTTDRNGEFFIEVAGLKSRLVIAYVGYETTEIEITSENDMVISLKPAHQKLEEIAVIGYGQQLKGKVAGIQITGSTTLHSSPIAQNRFYADNDKKYSYKNNTTSREGYDAIAENPFLKVTDNPLSTFSIDVDEASYSNIRRILNDNRLPPAGAVRIEEMINYFTYHYPQPGDSKPFSINTDIAACPWNEAHRIVSIGLQGKKIKVENLPSSNLVFLIDVSGSMADENKLPLVKASLKLLTEQLREQDKVSIVVYAGNAGLVLPPTAGTDKEAIMEALEELQAGGSTAGGQGIQLAYKTAKANFIRNGNNRVILCTDGDFNVGISSDDELERLIEAERKSGIFLTVLGYGMGNYQDAKMQKLADKGNGNHAYIDNLNEAKKVLVREFGATLFTIAKDVKLQVEFNPAMVQGYRLIGYENRMLAKEDFNNDKKDAGELGSGHTVTALYEIVPVGIKSTEFNSIDSLKYQRLLLQEKAVVFRSELMNIKLRYKQPDGEVSKLLEHPVMDKNGSIETASDNLRFAAAVAQFGMLLRNSAYKANSSYAMIEKLAANSSEYDTEGYRKEFLELVKKARKLSKTVAVNRE